MKVPKRDRPNRAPAPRGLVSVALVVCSIVVTAPWIAAQYSGGDWGLDMRHQSAAIDTGQGAFIDAVDSVRLFGEVYQRAGRFSLTYRLGAGFAYSAQLERQMVLYPGRSGFALLRAPMTTSGAWLGSEIGRIALSDPFGVLFFNPEAREPGQLADGFEVHLRRRRVFASFSAGYLGWLDKRVNRVRMTARERLDATKSGDLFARPRGIAVGRVEVEDLIHRQDAGAILVAQQDFGDRGGSLSSYYAGVFARGPALLPALHHRSVAIVAYSVSEAPSPTAGVSLLARSRLAYTLSPWWVSNARFALTFAGGGILAPFPALAGPDVSVAFAEQLSDVVVLELGVDASYRVAPAEATIRPDLALRLIWVPSGTITPQSKIEPNGVFGGFEIGPAVVYQPIRGLDVIARAGILFGNTQRTVIRFEGRITL